MKLYWQMLLSGLTKQTMNQFYQETRMHETNVDLPVLTLRRLRRLQISGSGFNDDSLSIQWPGEDLEEDGGETIWMFAVLSAITELLHSWL